MKRIFVINSIIQFVLLMGVWLLMSGHYDVFHVSMGVLSSAMVLVLHLRIRKYYYVQEEKLDAINRLKEGLPFRLRLGRAMFYIPWIMWQIVLASLQVAGVVLKRKMVFDPSIVKFTTNLPNTTARIILSNSITLTPGTITLDLNRDEFVVHSLMDASSSGIVDGSLPGEVAKLYEKKPEQVMKTVKIIRTGAEL